MKSFKFTKIIPLGFLFFFLSVSTTIPIGLPLPELVSQKLAPKDSTATFAKSQEQQKVFRRLAVQENWGAYEKKLRRLDQYGQVQQLIITAHQLGGLGYIPEHLLHIELFVWDALAEERDWEERHWKILQREWMVQVRKSLLPEKFFEVLKEERLSMGREFVLISMMAELMGGFKVFYYQESIMSGLRPHYREDINPEASQAFELLRNRARQEAFVGQPYQPEWKREHLLRVSRLARMASAGDWKGFEAVFKQVPSFHRIEILQGISQHLFNGRMSDFPEGVLKLARLQVSGGIDFPAPISERGDRPVAPTSGEILSAL